MTLHWQAVTPVDFRICVIRYQRSWIDGIQAISGPIVGTCAYLTAVVLSFFASFRFQTSDSVNAILVVGAVVIIGPAFAWLAVGATQFISRVIPESRDRSRQRRLSALIFIDAFAARHPHRVVEWHLRRHSGNLHGVSADVSTPGLVVVLGTGFDTTALKLRRELSFEPCLLPDDVTSLAGLVVPTSSPWNARKQPRMPFRQLLRSQLIFALPPLEIAFGVAVLALAAVMGAIGKGEWQGLAGGLFFGAAGLVTLRDGLARIQRPSRQWLLPGLIVTQGVGRPSLDDCWLPEQSTLVLDDARGKGFLVRRHQPVRAFRFAPGFAVAVVAGWCTLARRPSLEEVTEFFAA